MQADNELTLELNEQDPLDYVSSMQMQDEMQKWSMNEQKKMEESRRAHENKMENRRVKIDMIKIATDTLTENARSKPVADRDISSNQIKEFAEELINYVNQE